MLSVYAVCACCLFVAQLVTNMMVLQTDFELYQQEHGVST